MNAAPVLMEDHDGAYWAWKKAGFKDRLLFHFDAHVDFSWIAPSAGSLLEEDSLTGLLARAAESPIWELGEKTAEDRLHLGNFIHEAIKGGIVREFFWIYPDDADAPAQAEAVGRILRSMAGLDPRRFRLDGAGADGCFDGAIYGRPFHAAPLSALARFVPAEDVLLDVDLDFFATRSLHAEHYPYHDPVKPSCWLSPRDFLERLGAAGLAPEFATVAYSVEEGYTPIGLKFLGDELAGRLSGALGEREERRFAALRRVHEDDAALDTGDKIRLLESELGSGRAPDILFNLAVLLSESGDIERARSYYEEAVGKDPSYRTAYNHPGPVLEALGRGREAEAAYAAMLRLDARHPGCRLFGFQRAVEEKSWDAVAALGTELFAEGRRDPELLLGLAERRLALGQSRRCGQWLALCDEARLAGPQRRRYWLLKARAAQAAGLREESIAAYSILARGFVREPEAHFELAKLYLRQGNLYKARRHAVKAFRQRRP